MNRCGKHYSGPLTRDHRNGVGGGRSTKKLLSLSLSSLLWAGQSFLLDNDKQNVSETLKCSQNLGEPTELQGKGRILCPGLDSSKWHFKIFFSTSWKGQQIGITHPACSVPRCGFLVKTIYSLRFQQHCEIAVWEGRMVGLGPGWVSGHLLAASCWLRKEQKKVDLFVSWASSCCPAYAWLCPFKY